MTNSSGHFGGPGGGRGHEENSRVSTWSGHWEGQLEETLSRPSCSCETHPKGSEESSCEQPRPGSVLWCTRWAQNNSWSRMHSLCIRLSHLCSESSIVINHNLYVRLFLFQCQPAHYWLLLSRDKYEVEVSMYIMNHGKQQHIGQRKKERPKSDAGENRRADRLAFVQSYPIDCMLLTSSSAHCLYICLYLKQPMIALE